MKIEQKKPQSKNGDLYIYYMSLDQVDTCRHYGGEYDDLSATGLPPETKAERLKAEARFLE